MLKITFKSDQIIVSHSKQTILYHQVRQAFSQEFQVQIKIKSGGLHPIFKSNQVKSESSDLDFKSNQIDLIWLDLILGNFKAICAPLTFPPVMGKSSGGEPPWYRFLPFFLEIQV